MTLALQTGRAPGRTKPGRTPSEGSAAAQAASVGAS